MAVQLVHRETPGQGKHRKLPPAPAAGGAIRLVSVFGTLVADNVIEIFAVSPDTTTVAFAVLLAVTLTAWFLTERTVSISTVDTGRRAAFSWLAVLFTFELGSAAGHAGDEALTPGYAGTAILVRVLIIAVRSVHHFTGSGSAIAFWVAYVVARPVGGFLGDLGGLWFGTALTSLFGLAAISSSCFT
ncbi:hypothetical protein [Paractinoplanes durhamensis]|uniref:hypothetical protein n=1 Tax=Paractinoplanes durhamensis TaxID=113563 RepID=UPI003638AFF2